VAVLQYLHGEESIYNLKYVSSFPTTAEQEKLRLIGIYGEEPVNEVYPGRRPNIDGNFPGDKPAPEGEATPETAQTTHGKPKTIRPQATKTPTPKGSDTMKQDATRGKIPAYKEEDDEDDDKDDEVA
jgi:hypothetical protein